MRQFRFATLAAAFGLAAAAPAESHAQGRAPAAVQPTGPELSYADLADLSLDAPVAVHVRVTDAMALDPKTVPNVPAHLARIYVEADIVSLVRGPEMAPRVRYVVDLPRNAKGKAPKIRKKTEYILLARPVSGRPGELQLAAPDAQIDYSPARLDRVRAILREAAAPDAAPRITGIGRAFHVPGALAGESETQIFLQTVSGRPVSLNVIRRPGETPIWAVALSEIVDDSAAAPRPNSLLWYRLACSLPRALPPHSLADADAAGARGIQADYRYVIERLGPCPRTRARR